MLAPFKNINSQTKEMNALSKSKQNFVVLSLSNGPSETGYIKNQFQYLQTRKKRNNITATKENMFRT